MLTGGRDRVAVAALLIITATSLVAGIAATATGQLAAATYFLLFALTMGLVIALGRSSRHHRRDLSAVVRTVERDAEPATEIRCAAGQFVLLNAVMASFAVFCGVTAVDIALRRAVVPAVLSGALACFFASFVVAAALGHLRRGGVILSERGIAQCGWSFESRLDWSAIAGVKPAFNGYPVIVVIGYSNAPCPHRYRTRVWRIDRLPPVPMIEVDCRRFDVEPSALYAYIRTYVDEPAARRELGTDAALTRAAG